MSARNLTASKRVFTQAIVLATVTQLITSPSRAIPVSEIGGFSTLQSGEVKITVSKPVLSPPDGDDEKASFKVEVYSEDTSEPDIRCNSWWEGEHYGDMVITSPDGRVESVALGEPVELPSRDWGYVVTGRGLPGSQVQISLNNIRIYTFCHGGVEFSKVAPAEVISFVLPSAPSGLEAKFDPAIVQPLGDRQAKSYAASWTRLNLRIRGAVQQKRIHLIAKPVDGSGGHIHKGDTSKRPTGVFFSGLSDPTSETDVWTDADGRAEIQYRCSGIGGEEVVVATTDGDEAEARLTVRFELTPLAGTQYMELVGGTEDHRDNHYATTRTINALESISKAYAQLYPGRRLKINDISLPNGGPFDLGPNPKYRLCLHPFWYLAGCHFNHREGHSTDMPPGNNALRRIVRMHGGKILSEGDHWHVTTR